MLDFTHLSPEEFELLCEDILRSLGFTIESRPARGPDKGKDIIATRYVTDLIGNVEEERYLVECKHFSKSGKSVQGSDIGNFQAKISLHHANRYLLITTTIPSETVKDHLSAISRDPTNSYKAGFWARHDLSRMLEEYPLICDRYFPKTETAESPPLLVATEFACWMKATGFSPSHTLKGIQSGSIATVFTSEEKKSVLTFCVGGEGNIATLNQAMELGRSISANETWLVAFSRIAPSARQRASEVQGVKAITVPDYIRSIVTNYQAGISDLVEELGIPHNYVELGFSKPTFASDGSKIARDSYTSITAYVNTWCNEPSGTNVLLLGDFGSGKTWITLRYAALHLKEFYDNPISRRLPIYVPLRQVNPTAPIFDEVARLLFEHYGLQAIGAGHSLQWLNESGKLLLILDGFDEFGKVLDEERVISNIRALGDLMSPRSKLLLTSRGHVFKSSWHAQDLFTRATRSLDENSPLTFEVMRLFTEVAGLSDEQVYEIINRRVGAMANETITWIQSGYGLMDLARRPLLLNMIMEAFERSHRFPTTMFNLYENYTRLWLERERWRGQLGQRERSRFVEWLAWYMFSSNRYSVSFTDLEHILEEVFETKDEKLLDTLDYDIRTSTFLTRNAEGQFTFAHKSFMEFFAAKWIVNSLASGKHDFLDYVPASKVAAFTPEIDAFLLQADFPQPAIEFLKSIAGRRSKKASSARRVLELAKDK